MELNIKFDKKMIVETANRVLDEFKYNGKTIREWADLIANPKTNADKIRTMTDEELAELLVSTDGDFPPNCEGVPVRELEAYWLDWLREEAKE